MKYLIAFCFMFLISFFCVSGAQQLASTRLQMMKGEIALLANLDAGIDKLNHNLEARPDDAISLSLRGLAWHLKSEGDKALADLDKAIMIDQKNAHTYYFRGLVLYNKNKKEKSLEDLERCIAIDKGFYRAFNKRGAVWQDKGEWGKSLDDYSECLRLNRTFLPALINRANLYAGCPEGKYRDGKKTLENATRSCELTKWDNPVAWETLAAAYSSTGDYVSAEKWQKKAVEHYEGITGEAAAQSGKNAREWLNNYRALLKPSIHEPRGASGCG